MNGWHELSSSEWWFSYPFVLFSVKLSLKKQALYTLVILLGADVRLSVSECGHPTWA